MRRRHESPTDLKREKLVMEEFLNEFGGKGYKMPDSYILDFLHVIQGKKSQHMTTLEVKCRDIRFGQYPDLILSLSKWMAIARYHTFGFNSLLVAGMLNGIYLFSYDREYTLDRLKVEFKGRTIQQRDKQDLEPIVHVDNKWFKKISDLNVWEVYPK